MNAYSVEEKTRVGFFKKKTIVRKKSGMTFSVECDGGVTLHVVGYHPQLSSKNINLSLISINDGGHYLFVYQQGKVTYLRKGFSLQKVACVIAHASRQVTCCGWQKSLANQAKRKFPFS